MSVMGDLLDCGPKIRHLKLLSLLKLTRGSRRCFGDRGPHGEVALGVVAQLPRFSTIEKPQYISLLMSLPYFEAMLRGVFQPT